MQQQYDERNRDLIVGIDETLVHRDQAGISPFDSAVQGGDAVWEGLRLSMTAVFSNCANTSPGSAVPRKPSPFRKSRRMKKSLMKSGERSPPTKCETPFIFA